MLLIIRLRRNGQEGGEKARDSGIIEARTQEGSVLGRKIVSPVKCLIVKLKWGESFDNMWALRDSNEGSMSELNRTSTTAKLHIDTGSLSHFEMSMFLY